MGFLSEQDERELKLYEALKKVIDPELGISIVDMGLVYHVAHTGSLIEVDMTLSSKGCPMGELILRNVSEAIEECFPDVKQKVNLVWVPSWNSSFISASGKKALGH